MKRNCSEPPRFARFAHVQYGECLPLVPILCVNFVHSFLFSFFFVCVCVSGVLILHFSIHSFGLYMVCYVFVLIIVECKKYGVVIKTFIIIIIII